MISEAAKQVHVEAHVLRYWEDELDPDTGELMNASEVAESMEQYGF